MSEVIEKLLDPNLWVRKGSKPLYVQLQEKIAKAIKQGVLHPGEQLPSERTLAHISTMSRITVRKAIQELVHAGLVIQRQGSGTSISLYGGRMKQSLTRLRSFSEDMALRGKKVHAQWLECGLYQPSIEEAVTLGLKPHSQVSRLNRLRFANDVPLAIERASISSAYLPDPAQVSGSLYEYLDARNCKPVRAIQRICAVNLEPDHAKLLQVTAGSAGLYITRISYLANGKVIEFTQSHYLGEAYECIAELEIAKP